MGADRGGGAAQAEVKGKVEMDAGRRKSGETQQTWRTAEPLCTERVRAQNHTQVPSALNPPELSTKTADGLRPALPNGPIRQSQVQRTDAQPLVSLQAHLLSYLCHSCRGQRWYPRPHGLDRQCLPFFPVLEESSLTLSFQGTFDMPLTADGSQRESLFGVR